MFLKKLTIEENYKIIREITFQKGINLIVDETSSTEKHESGNNVGKTTVLRLIDFCLGGKGENIYKDPEFKNKSNTEIHNYLTKNNVTITLVLNKTLNSNKTSDIVIKRNFLSRSRKVLEINGLSYSTKNFLTELKTIIFNSDDEKPTFRQIIAKNIRDEKNRLVNTLKVLHPTTTRQEYEALYLFWLGINTKDSNDKQNLINKKRIEENILESLNKDTSISQIEQSLIIINRSIQNLETKRDSFNQNSQFETELDELNEVKAELNILTTNLSRLEVRKDLINESKADLEKEHTNLDTHIVRQLYEEANLLIPNLQKTFEDTVSFHNQMVNEKIKFITDELPSLEQRIKTNRLRISSLLSHEETLSKRLSKSEIITDLHNIVLELNLQYEKKGQLEALKNLYEQSKNEIERIDDQLDKINKDIDDQNSAIQNRTKKFNEHFSKISHELYGEYFVLSADKNDVGYELNISSINGNLGTGKKKGQIAAFDLAYIKFADEMQIPCLHFILHDQIENVHDNQISNLLNKVVGGINCQYILPVLKDKLPQDIPLEPYVVISLSQNNKLFGIN